jgi:menaquinone-specific isochorismate synthase
VTLATGIDPDVDLLAVAGDDGFYFDDGEVALAGRGVAVRVRPSEAASVLARLARLAGDDGASRPIAVGALPFQGEGWLTIPRLVVGRAADGTTWSTVVGDGDEPLVAPAVPAGDGPSRFTVEPTRPAADFRAAVAEAVAEIRAGRLAKVVLAREVVVEADRPWSTPAVLARLRAGQPWSTVFAVDGLVGASPERLVSRRGDRVVSHPLAGTARRPDLLLASAKDAEEHRLVVEAVAAGLRPWCSAVTVPPGPSVLRLGEMSHLGTRIQGRLAAGPGGGPSALDLALALHPTPAVAGVPTDAALAFLGRAEPPAGRGRYAGPVGWVDARGDGAFVVGIRSAQLDGRRASLWAGAGIVAGSDPDAELAETQLKLQPMLAALLAP